MKDPREEKDVAKQFPSVVQNMAKQHAKRKPTHAAPLKSTKFKDRNPVSVIPTGYGWVISDGRLKPKLGAEKK